MALERSLPKLQQEENVSPANEGIHGNEKQNGGYKHGVNVSVGPSVTFSGARNEETRSSQKGSFNGNVTFKYFGHLTNGVQPRSETMSIVNLNKLKQVVMTSTVQLLYF